MRGRTRSVPAVRAVLLAMVVALPAGAAGGGGAAGAAHPGVFEGPVPRVEQCAPGDRPEPGLQGEVSLDERSSGRSRAGYNCNLELVGTTNPADGASWQMAWYDRCAYYDTRLQGAAGVQVIDARDPAKPVRSTSLTTPAMLDPWESLKVTPERGLLASVAAWSGAGPLFFDVYDVKSDCANPQLLSSLPVNIPIGHEGEWTPDGLTYYGASLFTPTITAIDVSNPRAPRPVAHIQQATHGLSFSPDGKRAYLSRASCGNGLKILDTSEIQARAPAATTRVIGEVCWTDGSGAQMTIPVRYGNRPYVIFVDEGGYGMARIIDISDETRPFVISKLKLEINMPENRAAATQQVSGQGGFGYNAHYCGVDRRDNPTVVGCSYFNSGVRIFDIRDPYHPREIAYYNVGGTGTSHAGSNRGSSNPTSAYAASDVRFVPERSEVWFTDQDRGFFITRFADDPATGKPLWPFASG